MEGSTGSAAMRVDVEQMEMVLMMLQMEKMHPADHFQDFSSSAAHGSFTPESTVHSWINNNQVMHPNSYGASYFMDPLAHGGGAPHGVMSSAYSNPGLEDDNTSIDTSCSGGRGDRKSTKASNSSSSMAAMREMIFRMAALQPIHIDPESVKPPKRRNVRISKDPQSVAARHRRERISERIRILQRMVPGGTKMDTASMLDEAIHYVKFLKTQVQTLEQQQAVAGTSTTGSSYRPYCVNPAESSLMAAMQSQESSYYGGGEGGGIQINQSTRSSAGQCINPSVAASTTNFLGYR